jgi:ornithine cyclodeaminase
MIPFIDDVFIEAETSFQDLGELLLSEFRAPEVYTPMRHHHDYSNPKEEKDSTLLLMPAWEAGEDLGVKIVTVSPENGKYDLPSIQGSYLYLNAHNGTVRSIFDAKALTAKRTAAVSALAASFLANADSRTLLVLGTGVLAKNLILAHTEFKELKQVYVWGRSFQKASELVNNLKLKLAHSSCSIAAVTDFESVLPEADIISTATLADSPLVKGDLLRPGQHLDLVGSYKRSMREADDRCIERSSVYLDTYQGGLKESGDIVIPIEKGVLSPSDVKADLFELCSGSRPGRTKKDEITLFKSVGHASEDLIAARYYFEIYERLQKDT